jgi:hypothetical protein
MIRLASAAELCHWQAWLVCLIIWQLAIHPYPRGLPGWTLPNMKVSLIAGAVGLIALWLQRGVYAQSFLETLAAALWAYGCVSVWLMLGVGVMLAFRDWCQTSPDRPVASLGSRAPLLFWIELLIPIAWLTVLSVGIDWSPLPWSLSTPSPAERDAVRMLCYAAAVLFLIGSSNNLIRGLLSRYQVLPNKPVTTAAAAGDVIDKMTPPQTEVDTREIERGRAIGNIERVLLLIFISHNNYEALGFLLAAKGLIRSKEFEDRDRAEYILIGSLASALVAVLVSLLIQHFGVA